MQPDRCLHFCLLGDSGIGQSAFLQCYKHALNLTGASKDFAKHSEPFDELPNLESMVAMVELEGELCRVRFTDGAASPRFEKMQHAAIHASHVILLCFRPDKPETMASVKKKWLQRPRSFRSSWRGATVGCRPLLWQIRSETPWLLVSLQTDLRERSKATHGDTRRHSNGRSCATQRNRNVPVRWREINCPWLPGSRGILDDLPAVPRALALQLIRWPRKKPKPSSKVCELSSVAWGRFCLGRRSRAELAGYGGWGYMECSAFFPDTVQLVVDEALNAANSYYGPCPEIPASICAAPAQKISGCSGSCFLRMFQSDGEAKPCWTAAPVPGEMDLWLPHETLTVRDDPVPVTEEQVREGLSQLGDTGTRQHAYVRCDLAGMNLTSLVKIRQWEQLQFLNVSRNRLRGLEPIGALRHLLHLNASHNLLIRSQNFTAPDGLETCDMSYNMLAELGDWKVHRFLRELNLRGNYIGYIGNGLLGNKELRLLDLSENLILQIRNLEHLELRTLSLAQNKLSSVEGVQSLTKLHSLDVRHNNITTIDALHAQDIPRLRKLRVSENRISQMREVDQLADFRFLSELYLNPNPVSQLPQYRAQVLHRLPRLRSLDAEQVSPEERVKTEVIYGAAAATACADVETRREIFEQLLPEETFVDRRLMTEAGIALAEVEEFGSNGDAGPFGHFLVGPTFGDPPRTRLQYAKFRQRLELTRLGGTPEGVADFSNYPALYQKTAAFDEDLREILEAVAEGGCEELLLGEAQITPQGIRDIIAFMQDTPCRLCFINLSGCSSAALLGAELLKSFPLDRGCSIELENCGLADSTVARLRNKAEDASRALARASAERQRVAQRMAEHLEMQDYLEERAAEQRPSEMPGPAPARACHPAQWRPGAETSQKALEGFLRVNPNKLVQASSGPGDSGSLWTMNGKKGGKNFQLTAEEHTSLCEKLEDMLLDWGCEFDGDQVQGRGLPRAFVNAFGADPRRSPKLLGFMLWEGVAPSAQVRGDVYRSPEEWEAAWASEQQRMRALTEQAREEYDSGQQAPGVASGQLMAHLSFLAGTSELKAPSVFGFQKAEERVAPRLGEDLLAALGAGLVLLEQVLADGLGVNNLTVTLRSLSSEPLQIALRRGTIFQQKTWNHRQNLVTGVDYVLEVPPGGCVRKEVLGFSLNFNCPPPRSDEMHVTEFYFDIERVLGSQALIWDHMQAAFHK
ncbi:LRGUK [Symbiodinium sp. CCMP2456]|nr:LRGUK [Symbiodinium sp. CCMP2456]